MNQGSSFEMLSELARTATDLGPALAPAGHQELLRSITDILWTGSPQVRGWRSGDVRIVYYSVMAILVLWGVVALRLAQPVVLLKISANVAGGILVVSALHLLYVNSRLLPEPVRPPTWRRLALVATALFYGFFVALSLGSVWTS